MSAARLQVRNRSDCRRTCHRRIALRNQGAFRVHPSNLSAAALVSHIVQVEAAATCVANSVVRASHGIPLRAGDRGEYILTCKDEVHVRLRPPDLSLVWRMLREGSERDSPMQYGNILLAHSTSDHIQAQLITLQDATAVVPVTGTTSPSRHVGRLRSTIACAFGS